MRTLEEARVLIDGIDREIARLFEDRMSVVEDVVTYKIAHQLPIFDSVREQAVIAKNVALLEQGKYRPYYRLFLQQFMDISKEYQKSLMGLSVVGFQGVKGAFGQIATERMYPDHPQKAYATFEDVVLAVVNGEIEYGVLPFENSYTGEVGEVLDLLRRYPVFLNGSYDLAVTHNLMGIEGTKISELKQVYSHQQALAQCKPFLSELEVELIPHANTAMAAKYIKEQQDHTKAAIASKETAQLFGLSILQDSIQSSKENTTRFIVIGKELRKQGNRFCLLFTVNHQAGQLAKVIQVIADHGYNMESIHSRALVEEPWKYYFFVEIAGSLQDVFVSGLLEELELFTQDYKIVGGFQTKEE